MTRSKTQSPIDDIPEDLGSAEARTILLSRLAREAYACGQYDNAIKAIRALSQLGAPAEAEGRPGSHKAKALKRMATHELQALRAQLKGGG